MKSQIAKRININLTQKQVDELKYIEANKTGEKYMDSDIVRDAIDTVSYTHLTLPTIA